jgi:UDP-N-acetylglucosamine 2-epimerase (non-hydrolysing)
MLVIAYGTRPEFLKLKILIDRLRTGHTALKVVRIDQHADFKEDAGYHDAIVNIESAPNRISAIGSSILHGLPSHLAGASALLVQGDTASVFYSAVAAFQCRVPIVHLEAGMRTYNLDHPFPEEGYRQMISRIATLHLCPSMLECIMLSMREGLGHDENNIFQVGNTILDLAHSYGHTVRRDNHVIITLHRRENWADYRAYINTLAEVAAHNADLDFHFYTHPNPALQRELETVFLPPNFTVRKSLDHRSMMEQLAACAFVITDSGGIQEEANFYGKHIYVLRQFTERASIDGSKITMVISADALAAIDFSTVPTHASGHEYGNGNSVQKILDILAEKKICSFISHS